MTKRVILVTCSIGIAMSMIAQSVTAEEIWVEGMSWKEVNQLLDDTVQLTEHTLGAPVQINGHEYFPVSNEQNLYVRAEANCVFCYCPDIIIDGEVNEICCYDFNGLEKSMSTVIRYWGWNTFDDTSYIVIDKSYVFTSVADAPKEFLGAPNIKIYTQDNGGSFAGGIGELSGRPLLEVLPKEVPVSLVVSCTGEILNPKGEILYRDERMNEWENYSKVDEIKSCQEDNQTYYDLFGHIVSSPRQGNIYIKNGRKVILK